MKKTETDALNRNIRKLIAEVKVIKWNILLIVLLGIAIISIIVVIK